MQTETERSRFDYTQDQRDALNAAVKIDFVDAVEIGVMMINHGDDFDAMLDELTEAAFSCIHYASEKHAAWCDVANNYSKRNPRKRHAA